MKDHDDGARIAELYLRHVGSSPRKLQEEPDDTVRLELQTVIAGNVIEDPKVNVPPQD